MWKRLNNRFLLRLHAPEDAGEMLRVERVLASARVFLTSSAIFAIYLDPTDPDKYATLAYSIIIGYFGYSAAVWIWVHRVQQLRKAQLWIHVFDIIFPTFFMLFTAGPNSPFFVFLLFLLIAAAFRWGLPRTIVTAFIVTAIIVAEAAVLSYGPRHGWIEGQYEINRFVIRISYLITLGALIGYLGEEEQQWRAESSTVNRLLGSIRVEHGMRGSMQAVMTETLRVFGAARCLIAMRQTSTERVFLWRFSPANPVATTAEVPADERSRYAATLPFGALYASKDGRSWRCWAVGNHGERVRVPAGFAPHHLPEMDASSSLMAISLDIGEEWRGVMLLFDAVTGPETYNEVSFAHTLMRRVGPELYNVFLIRRLRSRAGAIERARVARELHDGTIQALISVEMQVDVLRRQIASASAEQSSASLGRIQELLREQIFELRMLMQQMRPVELQPSQMLDYMADMVDRFRRDTGINARFVSSLEEITLPPRVARELVRILQEALVNIRKHSGAGSAEVRFGAEDGCWKLAIGDNGRGFEFSGRLVLEELESSRRGPAIIKERVRSLGGDLAIVSTPGAGSELVVTLPQKANIAYV